MLKKRLSLFGNDYSLYDLIKLLLLAILIIVSFCFWTVILNAVFFKRPEEGAYRADSMAIVCSLFPFVIGAGQALMQRENSVETWLECTMLSGVSGAICCLLIFARGGMDMNFGSMLFILFCSLAGCSACAGLFAGLRKLCRKARDYVAPDGDGEKVKSDVLKYTDIK